MKLVTFLMKIPIKMYRMFVSPFMKSNCRFEPTCSMYALEALEVHGPIYGTWLSVKRILRCRPFGGQGFDPVPAKNSKNT